MKKALSFILVLCLLFAAIPTCVSATENSITISTDVERLLYYTGDTVKVNIDLSNNNSGIATFRGILNYDSKNLTFDSIVFPDSADKGNDVFSLTHTVQNGYIQILWDISDDITNYLDNGTIATLFFTVNEDAENKDYEFSFSYTDGARYVLSENFSETTWEYVTDVVTVSDSMTVNTEISSKLYFKDAPTGAYAGESITLDVAFDSEDGLYIFNSKLHYDTDNYTLTECVGTNDALSFTYNEKDNYINLLWDSVDAENFAENNAVIASLTFAVKEDAKPTTSSFELEYIDAVSIDLTSGADVKTDYFNAFSCEFPLLNGERIPVTYTLNRGNSETETVELYAGEKLVLPDTNFVDKTWYTSPTANVESVYNEKICPQEGATLYSSACAVDYSDDFLVSLRYSQDFSVVKENGTETLHFASCGISDYARMFRLSKVKDNVTYKLSVTYKAALETQIGFGVASGTGDNMYVNTSFFEGDATTPVYTVKESTNGYITADIYFTASLKGVVNEQSVNDDTKTVNGNGWAFLTLINSAQAGSDEIWISDITLTEVGSVITAGGASILNDEAANVTENKQALRYYFNYNTVYGENDELKIVIGNKSYEIVARGFLYRNGAINKYTDNNNVTKEGMTYTAAQSTSDIITQIKTKDFNECWTYDTESGDHCFSTYISGYTEDMFDYKLMVRGFVTFRDEAGNEFTVYSSTINRSVNGIKANPLSGVDVL